HLPMDQVPGRIKKLYAGKTDQDLLPADFGNYRVKGGTFLDYYQVITHLDEQVGLVLDALDKQGLAKDTVVVFLGDNGYMMGNRDCGGKVVPWEDSVRVPLIFYAPMATAKPGRSEAAISSLDLPPTFLNLAGIKVPG